MDVLIAELQEAGIKHSPDKIVRIAKKPDGKIVFLESGDAKSGLQHILSNHQDDFARRGILQDKIPDAVMAAVVQGKFLRYQGIIAPVKFPKLYSTIELSTSQSAWVIMAIL